MFMRRVLFSHRAARDVAALLYCIESLEPRRMLSVNLAGDVNQTPISTSAPSNLVDVGGTLYFIHNDALHGAEVWKSNGTTAGTTLLKDIRPGTSGSAPHSLANINGVLYFGANDG